MTDVRTLVRGYYDAWLRGDLAQARQYLAEDLQFTSPQESYDSAEAFLEACGHLSQGLEGLRYVRELYEGEQACVLLEWSFDLAGRAGNFIDAELLRVTDGRIAEILILNNDPEYCGLLAQRASQE